MKYFKKKKIFFFQQRYWGLKIGHPIAKRFYNQGAIIGALVFNSNLFIDYKEQKDFKYEWLKCYDDIIENPDQYLKGSEISLTDICKNLNIESVWPFVQTVREIVKSYKDKYFYGFKQNISDEDILPIIKATYKLIIDINNNFKPDIIILDYLGIMVPISKNLANSYEADGLAENCKITYKTSGGVTPHVYALRDLVTKNCDIYNENSDGFVYFQNSTKK
jgi:hypothetical protein